MELNLKKARKLEAKIQQHLDETPLDSKALVRTLGTLDEAVLTVSSKKNEVINSLRTREALLKARYEIRRLIEIKNEDTGVNELINSKIVTDKLIKEVTLLLGEKAFSNEELGDQLKANASGLGVATSDDEDDIFTRRKKFNVKTSFKVPVFEKEDLYELESIKMALKKQLEDLEDAINAKNLTNKVVLSQELTKLLASERIV